MAQMSAINRLGVLVCFLAAPAAAHLALWHPSGYGFNGDGYKIVEPFKEKSFDEWWFHGQMDSPPAEGEFMELPAGGTFHGSISCRRDESMFGANEKEVACDWPRDGSNDEGRWAAMHLGSDQNVEPVITMGTAIGIAYESDPKKVKPEDFHVISTNRKSPYLSRVDYQIPAGLPECPEGGCHCAWGWIHGPEHGAEEMYHTVYRCKVTGDMGTEPLPAAVPPVRCADDASKCVKGLKQMIYWVNDRANVEGMPNPYYNEEMGYTDGAQSLDGVTPPKQSKGDKKMDKGGDKKKNNVTNDPPKVDPDVATVKQYTQKEPPPTGTNTGRVCIKSHRVRRRGRRADKGVRRRGH